ncbi:MAG: hypothetical protein KKA16_10675 [Alphaproteobacteria bacterium]|nr:hypothetical protein [Alphaproteobacteria bacterium]MBU2380550.1 hypothetical protein [Alphaproteobacteria bacterium]
MAKKINLFTAGERRVAGLALLSAVVLALSVLGLEQLVRPSLGIYDSGMTTVSLPNVIDARPLGQAVSL